MSSSKNTTRFFMQQNRVHTSLSGNSAVVCLRAQSGTLAETRLEQESTRLALLAADSGDSVVCVKSQEKSESVAYNAYGVHSPNDIPPQRPAFNGHLMVSDLYLLGNGYRGYNPVLMRFQSPDSLSPFDEGGLNCYVYCVGDPINFSDPSGHGRTSRSPSPAGRKSPLTQIVLETLESDPGWHALGGKRRRLSSASEDKIVLEVLNAQPGWGVPSAAVQSRVQSGQATSSAQIGSSSAPKVRIRSGEGASDCWVFSRKPLEEHIVQELQRRNNSNFYLIEGFDLDQSREIRDIAIKARSEGVNVSAALRESKYQLSKERTRYISSALSRSIGEVRKNESGSQQ